MQFDPIDTTCEQNPPHSRNTSTYKLTGQTGTLATACAWCVVEVACGTIALCLPTLRPLMQQVTRKFDSLTNSKPSYPGGYPSGPGSVPTELVTIGGTGGTRSRQDNFQRLDNGSSPGVNGQDLYRQGSEAQKSEHNYASSGDEVPLHKDQAVSISVEPHRGNR